MKQEYEALFTPWKIGNVEIKNRIVMCSMGARGDESARIHSNLRDDFLMDFLAIIMTEYPETEFQHIVPFLPARQDDRDRSENVERFGKLCPLLFHNGNYKPMYYYTENAAMDDRFLLPNVMITSACVICAAEDWSYGILFTGEEENRFYSDIFNAQTLLCRRLGNRALDLEEQMRFNKELMNQNFGDNRFMILSNQPCLLYFVTEEDVRDFCLPGAVPESMYDMFFNYYQKMILKSVRMTCFFMMDGLRSFMDTGVIYELPALFTRSIAVRRRVQMLRQMIVAAKEGMYVPRVIKPDKLYVPRMFAVNYQGASHLLSMAAYNTDVGSVGFTLIERSVSEVTSEFMLFLANTDRWTYSVDDSITLLEELLKRYETLPGADPVGNSENGRSAIETEGNI